MGAHNYSHSALGRIWVLYNSNEIKLCVECLGAHFIHYKIEWSSNVFYWTCVYSCDVHARRKLWKSLSKLNSRISIPWLIQGGFNAIMCACDRVGGNLVYLEDTEDFKNWIAHSNPQEIRCVGPKFTWTNNQVGNKRIFRKLDWVFINDTWGEKWREAYCSIMAPDISDHCPLLICMGEKKRNIKSPFQFFNMWCDHPKFYDIVVSVWNTPVRGCSMFKLYYKLKLLRAELRQLNKNAFSQMSKKVKKARGMLSELQANLHRRKIF